MAGRSLVQLWLVWAAVALAAPFTPASDSDVVQQLPIRWNAAARAERAQLARHPQQLPLALATARAATTRARATGDPRELGLAQAALAPWWAQQTPPAPVRLLRATVLQSQHLFAAALPDLQALAGDPAARTTPTRCCCAAPSRCMRWATRRPRSLQSRCRNVWTPPSCVVKTFMHAKRPGWRWTCRR